MGAQIRSLMSGGSTESTGESSLERIQNSYSKKKILYVWKSERYTVIDNSDDRITSYKILCCNISLRIHFLQS